MDKQELLSLIEDVVYYEMQHDEMDEPNGLVWDVEATRDWIFDDMTNDETFVERLGKMKTEWEREEYAHLVALDWFSMKEPVFREAANV